MKFFASLLLIIAITEAAPSRSSQYDARPGGSMPCYLGCCKCNNLFPIRLPPFSSHCACVRACARARGDQRASESIRNRSSQRLLSFSLQGRRANASSASTAVTASSLPRRRASLIAIVLRNLPDIAVNKQVNSSLLSVSRLALIRHAAYMPFVVDGIMMSEPVIEP